MGPAWSGAARSIEQHDALRARAALGVEMDEIDSRLHGATVQLEVRGDYILDCHKQAIDANARGFALSDDDSGNLQPGNGTPGGTFVSVFRVQKRPEKAAYRS